MTVTGAQVVAERRRYAALFRSVTDEDRASWVRTAEFCRTHQEFLPYLRNRDANLWEKLTTGFRILAIEARDAAWRDDRDGFGGRPEQLIPGTPGSFSDRVDWRYWLLMGGRGSGKSRTGAEAIRELLFLTKWTTNLVRVAFVGRTLDAVRTEMFINTFMEVIPASSIIAWRSTTCDLWLDLGPDSYGRRRVAHIKGYSAERPDQLRGPNFHLAWCDEIAAWRDAKKSPSVPGTTWSNLDRAVRALAVDEDGNSWTTRIIATTTPKSVTLLRNSDPDRYDNPGLGLVDRDKTVTSSMSTLDNLDNLDPTFYESAIKPYEGTRLHDQEVLGLLMDEAVGALWSSELISAMIPASLRDTVAPSTRGANYLDAQAGGLIKVVIGVDPQVGDDPDSDETGMHVGGLGADGNAYGIHDASMRGKPSEVCERIAELYEYYGASAVVVEANQGYKWIEENLLRLYPNLPVEMVWAKKGKHLRATPIAMLSDKGRVRLAGTFPKLAHQMRTWVERDENGKTMPSPDRLDAFVYAMLYLLPVEANFGDVVKVVTSSITRR